MFVVPEEAANKLVVAGGRARVSRYLNRENGCGLSVSTSRVSAGLDVVLWYKHHVEANYILEGEVIVEDLTTGENWELGPGSLYVVGPNDRHKVRTRTDLYALSVFNPALVGDEDHDADGGYPRSGNIPPAWRP